MDILLGITTSDWLRLLKENNFNVAPKFWLSNLFFILLTLRNSYFKKKEDKHFKAKVENVKIEKDPVFILGHWRSGTSLLLNLLCLDEQFAFPNLFEIYNPHSFLTLQDRVERKLNDMPEEKRPMDNMMVNFKSPGEDEFALGILSQKSPMLGWVFPKNEKFYDRYLSFNTVEKEEIDDWMNHLLNFLKKLTYKYKRQLILKSPPHTARIKLLLEFFPNAKFVHIIRNPYRVFQSTVQLYEKTVAPFSIQKTCSNDLYETILKRYQLIYESYFSQRELIPKQNLIEIKFEDFVKDKFTTIRMLYDYLQLPNFENFKSVLKKQLELNSNYKKNKYDELEDSVKKQVYSFCRDSFDEWSYETRLWSQE